MSAAKHAIFSAKLAASRFDQQEVLSGAGVKGPKSGGTATVTATAPPPVHEPQTPSKTPPPPSLPPAQVTDTKVPMFPPPNRFGAKKQKMKDEDTISIHETAALYIETSLLSGRQAFIWVNPDDKTQSTLIAMVCQARDTPSEQINSSEFKELTLDSSTMFGILKVHHNVVLRLSKRQGILSATALTLAKVMMNDESSIRMTQLDCHGLVLQVCGIVYQDTISRVLRDCKIVQDPEVPDTIQKSWTMTDLLLSLIECKDADKSDPNSALMKTSEKVTADWKGAMSIGAEVYFQSRVVSFEVKTMKECESLCLSIGQARRSFLMNTPPSDPNSGKICERIRQHAKAVCNPEGDVLFALIKLGPSKVAYIALIEVLPTPLPAGVELPSMKYISPDSDCVVWSIVANGLLRDLGSLVDDMEAMTLSEPSNATAAVTDAPRGSAATAAFGTAAADATATATAIAPLSITTATNTPEPYYLASRMSLQQALQNKPAK